PRLERRYPVVDQLDGRLVTLGTPFGRVEPRRTAPITRVAAHDHGLSRQVLRVEGTEHGALPERGMPPMAERAGAERRGGEGGDSALERDQREVEPGAGPARPQERARDAERDRLHPPERIRPPMPRRRSIQRSGRGAVRPVDVVGRRKNLPGTDQHAATASERATRVGHVERAEPPIRDGKAIRDQLPLVWRDDLTILQEG